MNAGTNQFILIVEISIGEILIRSFVAKEIYMITYPYTLRTKGTTPYY